MTLVLSFDGVDTQMGIGRLSPVVCLALLCLLAGSGCSQNSIQPDRVHPESFASWKDENTDYKIGVGDEVEVKLPYNAEFNDRVTVGPDGQFTLPLVGNVVAEGRTTQELTTELNSRFRGDLRDPRVQVAIRNYASARIFVGGQVNNPGVYYLPRRIGVTEAVFMANGSMDTARMTEVVIIRRNKDGKPMMRTVDVANFVAGSEDDVPLHPFDIVFVPKSSIAELDQFMDQFVTRVVPFQRNFDYTAGGGQNAALF